LVKSYIILQFNGGIIMAIVKPFKGLRPKKDLVDKIVSPPYDVLSSEEARKMVEGNPYSFLHIIKPEVDLPEEINLYDEKVYQKAHDNFYDFIEKGYLFQEDKKTFYVYKQIMGKHVQIGFVAVSSVDDYEKGIIKKHELTREDKEIDRTKHILSLDAQAGPVFLVYNSDTELDNTLLNISKNEPEYHFTSEDGVEHIFWIVRDDSLIADIEKGFLKIPYLYVADGHHRSAAATRVRKSKMDKNPNHRGDEEYNFFLTVIFPHNQMNIMAYNRVIKDFNGLNEGEFLNRVGEKFNFEKTDKKEPSDKNIIMMYLNNSWYKLVPEAGIFDNNDPVGSLDVSILQNNIIDPILGIKNVRKDNRIDFVGGIRGIDYLQSLVDNGDFAIAFSMFPTSMEDLMKVADANKIMPPKSTWFEPKLRSGIVTHLLK
jgi:uncharacterized protein (DUF1015 family)